VLGVREAPAPQHELQQNGEAESRRTGLVAQQIKLVAVSVK